METSSSVGSSTTSLFAAFFFVAAGGQHAAAPSSDIVPGSIFLENGWWQCGVACLASASRLAAAGRQFVFALRWGRGVGPVICREQEGGS